VIAKQIKVRTC